MSFRDKYTPKYNYWNELEDADWSTNTTEEKYKSKVNLLNEKLIELTKVVESLQDRIEVLESIEEKNWDEKKDC
tara:strand:+ start:470 stop:691 length:222 start_codon:yes stop_codon:yes gene_type:complete